MCHSGVGLTPTVDGHLHHFSAGGLFNGLVLLRDDETGSYWDHITGECVHGPLSGQRMDESWGIRVTTVAAALADHPDLQILRSRPNLFGRLMGRVMLTRQIRGGGLMPWYFHTTMTPRDKRRKRMDQGLGVVIDGRAKYYPCSAIKQGIRDHFGERELHVFVRKIDRIPTATWEDGEQPFQLFTRWYGFSYTYPGCEIYSG